MIKTIRNTATTTTIKMIKSAAAMKMKTKMMKKPEKTRRENQVHVVVWMKILKLSATANPAPNAMRSSKNLPTRNAVEKNAERTIEAIQNPAKTVLRPIVVTKRNRRIAGTRKIVLEIAMTQQTLGEDLASAAKALKTRERKRIQSAMPVKITVVCDVENRSTNPTTRRINSSANAVAILTRTNPKNEAPRRTKIIKIRKLLINAANEMSVCKYFSV